MHTLHAMRGCNAYVVDVSYCRTLELDGVDVLDVGVSRILVLQSLPSSLVLL